MFCGTLKVPISKDKGLNMNRSKVLVMGGSLAALTVMSRLLSADPAGMEEVATGDPTPAVAAAGGLQLENPKEAFNDKEIGTLLLAATNWDLAETRQGAKGPFKTTGAHSFTITDGEYRYQFSISINRFHAKQADDALRLTPQEKRLMKDFNMTQAEILTLRERKKGANGPAIGSIRG